MGKTCGIDWFELRITGKMYEVFGAVKQMRQRFGSSVYPIVLRGINRGDIFFDNDYNLRFLETPEQQKRNSEYELNEYCYRKNVPV